MVALYIQSFIHFHVAVLKLLSTGTILHSNYFLINFLIMALQSFVGPWQLFQFLDPIYSR
jgi:hypothetical protein